MKLYLALTAKSCGVCSWTGGKSCSILGFILLWFFKLLMLSTVWLILVSCCNFALCFIPLCIAQHMLAFGIEEYLHQCLQKYSFITWLLNSCLSMKFVVTILEDVSRSSKPSERHSWSMKLLWENTTVTSNLVRPDDTKLLMLVGMKTCLRFQSIQLGTWCRELLVLRKATVVKLD